MWVSFTSLSCHTPVVGNVAVRSPSNSGLFALWAFFNFMNKAIRVRFSKYLVFDTASSMPLIKFSPCSVMYSSWWLAKQEGYVPLSLEVVIE